MGTRTTARYAGRTLDGNEFDRVIHILEVGTQRLAEDVMAFKAEAEKGDTEMATAAAMTGMAGTFQQYVTEGLDLAVMLRAARDGNLMLALVGFDMDEVEMSLEDVDEAVEEDREYRV